MLCPQFLSIDRLRDAAYAPMSFSNGSSLVHRCRMYKSQESGLFEYATAKIMKLMLAKELNKRLKV